MASGADATGGATAPQTLVSVDGGETYTTAQVFSSAASTGNELQTTTVTAAPTVVTADDQLMQQSSGVAPTPMETVEIPQKLEEPSTDV